jgi:signal transduction histidine kinase/CheY-like chemotaxis protein
MQLQNNLLKRILKISIVAVIYYVSARFGLMLALGNTNASPVWPPSGFAFAAVLILGVDVWPGIMLGAFLANVVVFSTNKAADAQTIFLMASFIAIGNTLEALAGHYLLNLFHSRKLLAQTRDFTYFILTTLLMCAVSCSVGTNTLYTAHLISLHDYKTVWFTWWMGDVSGIIVLTPVFLSLWNSFGEKIKIAPPWKFFFIVVVLAIYLYAVFNNQLDIIPNKATIFLLLILLTWCVFVMEQWQSSLIVVLVSSFSIWDTLQGKGPFISATQNESLLCLQIFLCVCAIMMMFLSTTIMERRESEERLQNMNNNLEKARKQLEESMAVKEQFLANMSHEIRTPMNAIVGFTELLQQTELNEEQQQYVDAVRSSGQNLLVIINDILDFSKIQSGKINLETTSMNLRVMMETVMAMMHPKASGKKINLSFYIQENIPALLLGDPIRLSQVLINLIDNGIKFTEEGEVRISVYLISENEKTVKLKFEIRDTGIGIPEDKLSSIFDGFTQASNETTRKYGGTGLGLAISKQLIELQNGSLQVESEINTGSIFTFNITFEKNVLSAKEKNHAVQQFYTSLTGIHILLVEDNELNQMLVQKMMNEVKCKVEVAENGRVAIQKIEKTFFDIILMDIGLPGIDGYEVTQHIRNKLSPPQSAIPIIAVTAHALKGEEEKCLSAGMNGYISKPFNKEELFEKIRLVLINEE